jgi:hypothetical protein
VTWEVENRAYLTTCLDRVRAWLEAHAEGDGARPKLDAEWPAWPEGQDAPQIRAVCERFGLTPFEREVLLLCAGMELDTSFPLLCARASGDPRLAFPTFALALACFPAPHWDALAPEAALRRFSLVEVEPGPVLTQARLGIPARVWQLLVGVEATDERISRHAAPLPAGFALTTSQEQHARHLAETCARGPAMVVQLCGRSQMGQAAIAARCAEMLAGNLVRLPAETLPAGAEMEALLRVLRREVVLRALVLLLDCHEAEALEASSASARRLLASFEGLLFVSTRERRPLGGRAALTVDVDPPPPTERRDLWRATIAAGDAGAEGPWIEATAARLADQFDVDADAIQAAASRAAGRIAVAGGATPDAWSAALWDACRAQARPRLDDLAQRIEPQATWDDLILPDGPKRTLRDVELFVRRRVVVEGWWSEGRHRTRPRGASALFAGPSGTGKTLAAEALATSLSLDLYRLDLSAVVSKYIGETEKNLRRIFDAAEGGGALLLFDEADALFGKRSEVKDSHDRYANIEVSYLLQRMESFRGLAILTTNMKSSLDQAFQRRLRFMIDFPFPDEVQREAIWRRSFPRVASLSRLDFTRLRRLNFSGGSIRNVAEHALFLAADEPTTSTGPVLTMRHLRTAVQREWEKLQQPLPPLDAGWE